MNEPVLLPCPFCGGVAEIGRVPDSDLYAVGCTDDFLCMGNINHMAMVFCTPENAAKAWNKRPASNKALGKYVTLHTNHAGEPLTDEEQQLKPCPRCGVPPRMGYACGEYFVHGPDPDCPYCGHAFTEMHTDPREEINAWNRRVCNG